MHRIARAAASLSVTLAGCWQSGVATDAGASIDAGVDAREDAWTCGAPAIAVIGREGGELVHCDGARVRVWPATVGGDTEMQLERVEDALPAPADPWYVLVGPAFRFTSRTSPPLAQPASIRIPFGGSPRDELAVLEDGAWRSIEACAQGGELHGALSTYGTFAVIHDTTVYSEDFDARGVGDGAIDFVLGDEPALRLAIDPDGSAVDSDRGPARMLSLSFWSDDPRRVLILDLAITPEGALTSEHVLLNVPARLESWQSPPGAAGGVVIDRLDGDVIEGTIDTVLRREADGAESTLRATFAATFETWRMPAVYECPSI